jgi:hypothetical protein
MRCDDQLNSRRHTGLAAWALGVLILENIGETLFVTKRARESREPFWHNVAKSFMFIYFEIVDAHECGGAQTADSCAQ